MKLSWIVAGCAVAVGLSAGAAHAQPPVPGGGGYSRPPAFSPYLNLIRGGGSPALNYYGIVRPQVQAREAILNLSNEVNQNQQAIGNLAAGGGELPVTGHMTQFMNLGGFFMNNRGGQIGSSTGGGTGSFMGSSAGGTNVPRVGGVGGAGVGAPRRR